MKQYCVRAVFSGPIHRDHWFKSKVTTEWDMALKNKHDATRYYRTSSNYADEFIKCEIWSREVSDWQKEK